MKDGICPKCGSDGVRVLERGITIGGKPQGAYVWIGESASATTYNTYLCPDCGYFESYIADTKRLTQVAENWPRARS